MGVNRNMRYTVAFILVFCMLEITHAGSRIEFKKMPCTMLQGITEREYTIYLPDDYNLSDTCTYPVLYLLHGGNCSNTDWVYSGNLQTVVDTLVSAGLAAKMIIVCPEGNKNNMIWFNVPHWKYEDFFFHEFMPYIETHYRVKPDKKYRSIAGYSMGGGASIVYGLYHPEKFHVVYGMSSYLRSQYLEFLKDDPSASWRQQLIDDNNPIRTIQSGTASKVMEWKKIHWFIDCGDKDFTYEANVDLIKAFREQNIPYEFRVKGGGHDWDYWRIALRDAIVYVSQKMEL